MADLPQEDNPLGMLRDIMAWMGSLSERRNEDPSLGVNRPSWGGLDPLAEEQARARLAGKIPIETPAPAPSVPDMGDILPAGKPAGNRKQQKGLSGVPLSQLGVGAQIKASNRLMRSKLRGTMPLGATFDKQGW